MADAREAAVSTNGGAAGSGIAFTLDGRQVAAVPGETILQAARRAGVRVPHLCYTDGMRVDGNCRACVVEIEGERVLAPSCHRTPAPGMVVRTASERARRSQRMVLELLLADMPDERYRDDSELHLWAEEMGVRAGRFPRRDQPAPDASHPAMLVRLDACIQCTRCVRACREVQVNDVIGYAGRAHGAKIVFDLDDPMGESTCVACGECVQACPTGALMPKSIERPAAVMFAAGVGRATDGAPGAVVARLADAAGNGASGDGGPFHGQKPSQYLPLVADRVEDGRGTRSVPSLCPYCGVGCQMTYHAEGERITHTTGRPGPANEGRLCVKGRFGFDYVHNRQRLTVPLIRRAGVPKDPHDLVDPRNPLEAFREATWEEALDVAAAGLRRLRDEHGGGSLAGFGSAKGSNEEAYLFQKLVRAGFGTNNVDHCTRLCHASSVAALLEMIGSGAVSNPFADVRHADVFIIIGANPTVNHPVAATFMKNAIERGSRLILVDPRETELSRLATHSLQFTPGSDVALLNAMLHTIVTEDLVDETFIDTRTDGWEAFRRGIRAYSPEAMEPICGLPAAEIRAAARLYATADAAMIFWGMGISQHTHGTDNARCLINLALVTGQIGRRGAGLHPLRGQNNVQGASDMGLIPMVYPDYQGVGEPAVRARFEAFWGTALDPHPGLTVVEIMNAALRREIRGMYIMGENPAMSDPDLEHVREALATMEWLVVQEIFLTETASFADVILPASAFPEKTGTFTNTDRRVQLGRQVLEPPGQARQDLWIIQEIARRIGLDWSYAGPAEVFEEIRQCTPSMGGITWERLEREHAVTYPCRQVGDPGQEVLFEDRFPTQNGLGHLKPVDYTTAAEPPDEDYPTVLITGRLLEHWHTGAMTRRAEVLDAIEPVPMASLNPATLQELRIEPGDPVTLETRRGRVVALARVDPGIPAGTVFLPFCYAEAPANLMTNPQLDPDGKIPEFKYCAVRVTAGGQLDHAGYAATGSGE
ncbi:MAG TPA: formate dehydrogenase subunit alpha [Longimicrobiales bacterium]|nr:formate dehydrogenase subunit alpha [Longimicrobiales bacterium]